MDTLNLARLQFGVTSVYHFLFVPLTIGLGFLVALLETRAYRSKDPKWTQTAMFFGKLLLINFALGVVTGIVQEFHFGLTWGNFSRYMGDILGAPLAIEALLAFFLESVFVGVYIFGRERVPKKVHLASSWCMSIGSLFSALWIIIVNSFMQEPHGFSVENGRARLQNFGELFSPHVAYQLAHVAAAGLVTAAVFMATICAWHLLRKKHVEVFAPALRFAVSMGLIGSLLVVGIGDLQGKYIFKTQPMKMAAAEALWETEKPGSLALFSVIDEKNKENTFEIGVPYMLSFLAYGDFNSEVKGIKELQAEMEKKYGPGNYIPPVTVNFWAFRVMVFSGFGMLLLFAIAWWLTRKGRIPTQKWLLILLIVILPLPYLSNSGGWILAEMGRQPWVVYGFLKTADAVSPDLPASSIVFSLVVFALLYGVLAVLDVMLLAVHAKKGPEAPHQVKEVKEGSMWN